MITSFTQTRKAAQAKAGNAHARTLRPRLTRPAALLLCLGCLLLSACASMLDPGPPPTRLQLSPAVPARIAAAPANKQLIVATPVAGREIDSDGIALIFQNREVRYLKGTRWTATVPFLVQRHLIEALDGSGALRGVSDETAGISANARLTTDLRQFGLHYADEGSTPTAVFAASFRLIDLSSGKVMATRGVESRAPAAGKDNAALARACEAALEKALAETCLWVADEMRRLK